jgi:hypothetical protein
VAGLMIGARQVCQVDERRSQRLLPWSLLLGCRLIRIGEEDGLTELCIAK